MTSYNDSFSGEVVSPINNSYQAVVLAGNVQTYWPLLLNDDPSQVPLASLMELSGSGSLFLPPAQGASRGFNFTVANVGVNTILVKDFLGSQVASISAGQVLCVYLKDAQNDAGTWGQLSFGSAGSSASASTLAGFGTKAIGNQLGVASQVVELTTATTLLTSHRSQTLVFTGSSAALTLSVLSTYGSDFFVWVKNLGSGQITLTPSGGNTIDGQVSFILKPGESVMLTGNGATKWYTSAYGRSVQYQFTALPKTISTSIATSFILTDLEAQNKLLQFNGILTQASTVIVPPIVSVYYVQCSFTGAFGVTIKTASGTGITLSSSDRTILFCDGVNVVSAQTATLPASNLAGGVPGALPYQSATGITAYVPVGEVGQVLTSNGVNEPTWTFSPTFSSPSLTGNLTFAGTLQRIRGDFSNATLANRLMFQTSTANGRTSLSAAPNGSGASSDLELNSTADPNNCSVARLSSIYSSDTRLTSDKTGSGAYLPMTFYTGGSERFRFGLDGQLGVGGANYGTLGQVLTSNGPSAAPTWAPAPVTGATSNSFFTNGVGVENQVGAALSGYNSAYLFNNATSWGLYSVTGGTIISYNRSQGAVNYSGGNFTGDLWLKQGASALAELSSTGGCAAGVHTYFPGRGGIAGGAGVLSNNGVFERTYLGIGSTPWSTGLYVDVNGSALQTGGTAASPAALTRKDYVDSVAGNKMPYFGGWDGFNTGWWGSITLPAGGTWRVFSWYHYQGGWVGLAHRGDYAGGTTLSSDGGSQSQLTGFYFRVA